MLEERETKRVNENRGERERGRMKGKESIRDREKDGE